MMRTSIQATRCRSLTGTTKKRILLATGGVKTVLHYCKFIPGIVLYASEDDETCTNGWYEHGKYPFVFDVMFPEKGSPAGFGYLDVMVNPQEYIDKLDSVILKSANLSKPRYFVSSGSNVNAEDFADLSKDLVEVSGTMDETKLSRSSRHSYRNMLSTCEHSKWMS